MRNENKRNLKLGDINTGGGDLMDANTDAGSCSITSKFSSSRKSQGLIVGHKIFKGTLFFDASLLSHFLVKI